MKLFDARRWAPVRMQFRVLSALVAREGLAKYGHDNLGFFWVMGEPLVFAGAVMALWTIIKHNHMEEVGLVLFVLTGYCAITLWRHLINQSVHALRRRSGLLYHANVKPLDILLAICVLETLGIFTAFMIAYIPLALFEVVHPIYDPLNLVGGFMLLGWFGSGFNLCLAALSERYEIIEKFAQATMYVTLPLTGVFTMVDWLPQAVQNVMLYSPMVNALEMFRSGVMPPEVVTKFSVPYLIGCCLAMSALGLLLMRDVKKHIGT
ncbi:ABC transporter permease [Bosea sp. 117]|uniref:ABC transporter permease n=1 Tax=Bosea sp. 117 TaxID=1125973 RepID=UPI0004947E21|nr:ABC transporter permease [Bosea sp. 117]